MSNIKDLKFDDKNFNDHTEYGMSLLEKSLQDYGAGRSILIDKNNNIIAGNGIVEAAAQAGIENVRIIETQGDELVAVKRTDVDLNTQKGREMAFADNATASVDLSWNKDNIGEFFTPEDTEKWGVDLDWEKEQEIQEDEAPEVNESDPAKSELGKVYHLGEHRLMCGDSTDAGNVAILMDGQKADMVFTDPPYGANMGIIGDTGEEFEKLFRKFYKVIPCNDNIYICCDWRCIGSFYQTIKEKHEIYNLLIWVKNLFGQGKLYHTKHEEIIFCGSGDYNKKSLNDDVNVWEADSVRNFGGSKNAKEAVGHPTQKPIEICARAIKNSSDEDEIIYDGFGGSGSTLIACEQLDRKCYMMELDPKYCDVIRKRYWKFVTGSEEGWEDGTK